MRGHCSLQWFWHPPAPSVAWSRGDAGDVDGMAVGIGAVKLPEMNVPGIGVDGSPAGRRNAFEAAVDEHRLGVGIVEAVIVGQAREHAGGPARRRGRVDGAGGRMAVKVQSTKTLPWFASVLRIHMKGPMDRISQCRKKAGPTPRMVSPSPMIVLSVR